MHGKVWLPPFYILANSSALLGREATLPALAQPNLLCARKVSAIFNLTSYCFRIHSVAFTKYQRWDVHFGLQLHAYVTIYSNPRKDREVIPSLRVFGCWSNNVVNLCLPNNKTSNFRWFIDVYTTHLCIFMATLGLPCWYYLCGHANHKPSPESPYMGAINHTPNGSFEAW